VTRRLLLSYLSITLLVLVVFGVPLGLTYAHRQVGDVTAQIERDAFALASFAEDALEGGGSTADLALTAHRYQDRTQGRVVIVDTNGTAIVDTEPTRPGAVSFGSRPEIARALGGEVASGQRDSSTLGAGLVYVAVPVASGGTVHGAVRITYDADTVDDRVRRYWLVLASAGAVSLAAVALVGLGIARWVASPLRELRRSVAAIGSGDLHARANPRHGPREVREVASAFNAMADRLETLLDAQDAFVADASHQLRTPLTALRLRLENLDSEVSPAARRDLDAAATEVARLSRIIDGLLSLARADRTPPQPAPIDVMPLLHGRREAWAPLAAERGLRLEVAAVPAALTARCTPDHLVQVIDNLLANAFDVAPAGTAVQIAAQRDGDHVAVHVVDAGPGLDEEARARAFDRFWSGSPGANGDRSLGGSGLGLAIVARLVRADGGTVSLDASSTGGVDAVVRYASA
jgi:signal transduction histidine kinase